MKKEEKELLLKDLCARLSYGIICNDLIHGDSKITEIDVVAETVYCDDFDEYIRIKNCKPYLRPMSSMTEEEKDKLQLLHDIICDENYGDRYSPSAWSTINEWVDYCNSRHLDHYGLIPMGLALEAPENMYSIELK